MQEKLLMCEISEPEHPPPGFLQPETVVPSSPRASQTASSTEAGTSNSLRLLGHQEGHNLAPRAPIGQCLSADRKRCKDAKEIAEIV